MACPEKVVIGNAELWLGDCREILPELGRFDLLLTDPPYGIGESSRKVASRGKLAKPIDYGYFNWDSKPVDAELLNSLAALTDRAIVWGGNYFDVPPSAKWLVWDKQNAGNDFADCELAWTNMPGAVRIFRHMWNGMLRASERDVQRVHPTQKPVALMEWCLQQAGSPRSVLDPFAGSFSTGVACARLGIPFVGIEREPRYFEAGLKRVEQAQVQGKLFLPEPPRAIVQEALAL